MMLKQSCTFVTVNFENTEYNFSFLLLRIRLCWCEVSSSRIVNWIFFISVEELLSFEYNKFIEIRIVA